MNDLHPARFPTLAERKMLSEITALVRGIEAAIASKDKRTSDEILHATVATVQAHALSN